MHRVTSINSAGQWNTADAADRVVLDAGDRNRRRIVLTGEKGTEFLLDFEKPVSLRDGDGLVLDDGSIVLVAGEPEKLIEISAGSALDTVRLAWHLGNRHTDVQIAGDKVRIRRARRAPRSSSPWARPRAPPPRRRRPRRHDRGQSAA